jgi:ribosome-associated translation inhibitor RaiA
METPVQIDSQNMQPAEYVRSSIAKHVNELESRFGRMTSCRVILKPPSGHHHSGGLYEVNIHLILPGGREVDIGRTPIADERHADVAFAVNDAFKRARRRLQAQVRRMQGHMKTHERRAIVTAVDGAEKPERREE